MESFMVYQIMHQALKEMGLTQNQVNVTLQDPQPLIYHNLLCRRTHISLQKDLFRQHRYQIDL